MAEIVLDLKKSLEQNAEVYFQKAKKLKKKMAGALDTIQKVEKQLKSMKPAAQPKYVEKHLRKKAWYEKFRWFLSSEGFLAVGGRDATSNEIVVKKHAEPNDLVFHTDMAGSPFFVLKITDKKPTETTLKEVADATCSFSRAWRLGLTSTDVFCVKPEQVTKQAGSGEYLPKGAFMIRGKTNYIQNIINLAVGIYNEAIMAGPIESVRKHCKKFVELVQGDKKASDAAKSIQRVIGGDLDEIIRSLPSGGCDISK